MSGIGGFLGVVMAELVAGGLILTWCSPLWNEAKRSYFTLYSGLLVLLLALPTWLAIRTSAEGGEAATWAVRLALATVVLVALTTIAMLAHRQGLARVLGFMSIPVAAAVPVLLATLADRGLAVGLVQVAAGARFLGAAYDALLLGHWYLTDRKLPRRPIRRATDLLLAACVLEAVVIAATGFAGGTVSTQLNPILAIGDVVPWIAIGMALATLLIAALMRAALRGQRASAVQSATGFAYLAVLFAIVGEIAVKTRFFPG